jgi:hypothetical protein
MQDDHRGPEALDAEKVRADAWALLEQIKTTPDKSKRHELARRAFTLAQMADHLESEDGAEQPVWLNATDDDLSEDSADEDEG